MNWESEWEYGMEGSVRTFYSSHRILFDFYPGLGLGWGLGFNYDNIFFADSSFLVFKMIRSFIVSSLFPT